MKLDKPDRENSLNVSSIESFGTVDGPGVRFVVFLKGCPLRCAYCHNPETWATPYQENIIHNKDIAKQVISVKAFMNGGAITVSGGEPLLQIRPLINLFKMLKKEGVHTCIDTSGWVPLTEELDELISLTDLFMVDIKHIDNEKCKELTGVGNDKSLAFMRHLDELNRPIWIRHVLVPGITTPREYLEQTRAFIDTLHNVEKIEVLPYHTLGTHKYDELGLEYRLKGVEAPTKEEVELARSILGC